MINSSMKFILTILLSRNGVSFFQVGCEIPWLCDIDLVAEVHNAKTFSMKWAHEMHVIMITS